MNILSLLIAYYVGSNLAKQNGLEGNFEGLVSVCAFICAVPTTVTGLIGNESVIIGAIGVDVTNSKGLFVAVIVLLIAIFIEIEASPG